MKEMFSLFDSWHQWKVCMWSGCKSLAWGLWRIVTGIVLGIASIMKYVGVKIEEFCKREPMAAVIVAVVVLILGFGWFSSFVNGRIEVKKAQWERDSISLRLDRYMQAYDTSDIVIVRGDTINPR